MDAIILRLGERPALGISIERREEARFRVNGEA
jgi:hypothetical protein